MTDKATDKYDSQNYRQSDSKNYRQSYNQSTTKLQIKTIVHEWLCFIWYYHVETEDNN
jgi:hypothetical protein